MNTVNHTKDYIKSLRTGHVLERYPDKIRVRVCKPFKNYNCDWCDKDLDDERVIKTERTYRLLSVECIDCYLTKSKNKGYELVTLNIFPNHVWAKRAANDFIVNTGKKVQYDKSDDKFITLSEIIYFRDRDTINNTDFIRNLKFHYVNGIKYLSDSVQEILTKKIIRDC